MENRNIIIILLVIIAILGLVVGVMFTQSISAKESTKIKITSNKTLTKGDKLSIQLTDLNKTAISKQKVNVTVKNSKGKVVLNKTLKTNDKGKAKLDLDLKKGKYNVSVSYGGNENYTGNNTTQKLTIKEKVVEEPVIEQSTDSSSSSNDESSSDRLNYDSKYNIYYDDNGVVVDPKGNNYMGDAGKSYGEVREKYEWIEEHGLQ